ncbi:hypothetical protein HDU96_003936 [Phlyctochytrium bullatum]|nr:hypothetical protein HDU96_003936 [Phlyctochytrium bullatum]
MRFSRVGDSHQATQSLPVPTTTTVPKPPVIDDPHILAALTGLHITPTPISYIPMASSGGGPVNDLCLSIEGLLALTTLHRWFLERMHDDPDVRDEIVRKVVRVMALMRGEAGWADDTQEEGRREGPRDVTEPLREFRRRREAEMRGEVFAPTVLETLDVPEGTWETYLADWGTAMALEPGYVIVTTDPILDTMLGEARDVVATVRKGYWLRLLSSQGVSGKLVELAEQLLRSQVAWGAVRGEAGSDQQFRQVKAKMMGLDVVVVRVLMRKYGKETEVGLVSDEVDVAEVVPAIDEVVAPSAANKTDEPPTAAKKNDEPTHGISEDEDTELDTRVPEPTKVVEVIPLLEVEADEAGGATSAAKKKKNKKKKNKKKGKKGDEVDAPKEAGVKVPVDGVAVGAIAVAADA